MFSAWIPVNVYKGMSLRRHDAQRCIKGALLPGDRILWHHDAYTDTVLEQARFQLAEI